MLRTGLLLLIILSLAFQACKEKKQESPGSSTEPGGEFIARGDSLVRITFDSLRNTLSRLMTTEGPQGAVRFCNLQALQLTNLHSSDDISIGRVTDKTRNPGNALSELDKKQFEKYIALLEKKDSLPSVVITQNNKAHYYKPILIQSMCLNCHGVAGKEIPAQVVTTIDSLYPSDMAKGYKSGELRGMWHIVFNLSK